MTKILFFSSSFFHQSQDELKYFKLITWPLDENQHSELTVIERWSKPIVSAVQTFLPPFFVQAPSKFTILRWWPMWIKIFSSVISALYSLAVAPSVNTNIVNVKLQGTGPAELYHFLLLSVERTFITGCTSCVDVLCQFLSAQHPLTCNKTHKKI